MDDNWEPDGFKESDLDKQVLFIHICAYLNENNLGDEVGNPPTNHWAIFLENPALKSVRLDMSPGYGTEGRRGKIYISSKEYEHTDKSIHTLTFEVASGVTVGNIVDWINYFQRQKYTFTEEWEGCRYWVYTVLGDLEAEGIIGEGSSSLAWESLSLYHIYPSGAEQREVRKGRFRSH